MKSNFVTKRLLSLYEAKSAKSKKSKNNKPDYIDVDKDGDKKETMAKALKDKKRKPKTTPMKENLGFAEAIKLILEK